MKNLIASTLKMCRKSLDLKQNEISRITRINHKTYCDIERGHILPTLDDLWMYCKAFGISADYLLGLTNIMAIHSPSYVPVYPVVQKDILGAPVVPSGLDMLPEDMRQEVESFIQFKLHEYEVNLSRNSKNA